MEINEAARAVVPMLPELAKKARTGNCDVINTLASLFSENKELHRSHPVLKALGKIFAGHLSRLYEMDALLNVDIFKRIEILERCVAIEKEYFGESRRAKEFSDEISNTLKGYADYFDRGGRSKENDESDAVKEQDYQDLKQTSTDRFSVKLKNFNIGTIGYRNADVPSFGIVIANTLNALLGTGEKVSSNAEDHVVETKTSKLSWSHISVNYETENRRYTHIDFINDADVAKGMMLTDFDGMILVIDAQNRCTNDWKEQLRLARATGVASMVVFVDHCDGVEDEELNRMSSQIQELLDESGYFSEDIPIIYGSINHAQDDPDGEWGERILNLVETIDEYVPEVESLSDKPFLMPAEDIYEIHGRGVVATGRVETGIVKVNDRVELVGLGAEKKVAVVTGIEMFRKLLDFAEPGDNIGLMLRGIAREDIKRGQIIANVGTCKSSNQFAAVLHYLSEDALELLKNDTRLNVLLRTAALPGKVSFSEGAINKAGQYAEVVIELSDSVAVNSEMLFYIYDDCKNLLAIGKVK